VSSVPEPMLDASDDGRRSGRGAAEMAAVVADAVGIGLWLLDADGRTLYRNASLDRWLGEIDSLRALAASLPGVPIERFVERLRPSGLDVATGVFRAMMDVALVNQGPVTILLDSRKQF